MSSRPKRPAAPARHPRHPLGAAEEHRERVLPAEELREDLVGVLLEPVLDVHLLARRVLLLARDRVRLAEALVGALVAARRAVRVLLGVQHGALFGVLGRALEMICARSKYASFTGGLLERDTAPLLYPPLLYPPLLYPPP